MGDSCPFVLRCPEGKTSCGPEGPKQNRGATVAHRAKELPMGQQRALPPLVRPKGESVAPLFCPRGATQNKGATVAHRAKELPMGQQRAKTTAFPLVVQRAKQQCRFVAFFG